MPGLSSRLVGAAAMLTASLAWAGCGGGTKTDPDAVDVPITLASHDGAISIIGPNEKYPCVGFTCELQNGGFRTIFVKAVDGQAFEFKAYFGGFLRDTRSCRWRGQTAIMVDWQNGVLNCINWSPN